MRFKTMQEALAAGWVDPKNADHLGRVIDTSGPGSYGYSYSLTLPDGRVVRSQTVSLTDTRNAIGTMGAFTALFPPVEGE